MDLDGVELEGLTEEEIQELSEYLDPDNELLPAADRVPAQTRKKPTGPYDRKRLLAHLEDQALKSTVGEDYIPFVKKQPSKETKTNKPAAPAPKPVATEFDDMLSMLDEDELAELASELGIHGIISQAQSRGDEKPVANARTGLHAVGSAYSYQPPPPTSVEPENPQNTDAEEVIQRLKDNDPSLTEVNLNNHGGLDSELIVELFSALRDNVYLESLQMSNVKVDENLAFVLAEVLATNCTLKVLNLESNRITRKGIKAIMKSLAGNQGTVLRELRMVNQYFAGGAGAEGEIAKYLDKITTITKLGYNFTVPSYRSKVDGLILRNLDFDRKRRTSLNY